MFKVNKIATITVMAIGYAFISPANASWCSDKVTMTVHSAVDTEFNKRTVDVQKTLRLLRQGGMADSSIYQELSSAVRSGRSKAHALARDEIRNGTRRCERGFEPVQNIVDDIVASATFGISRILPKHITHVDVGQILGGGRFFGGDNSVFRDLGIKW